MTRLALSLFFASSLLGCATLGPKVYVSRPAKGGAVRAQSQELIPYVDTDGAYLIFPKDLELIILEARQRSGKEPCK